MVSLSYYFDYNIIRLSVILYTLIFIMAMFNYQLVKILKIYQSAFTDYQLAAKYEWF